MVLRALYSQEGFRTIPLCDPLDIDLSKDSDTAKQENKQRAMKLISDRHADLLLYGYVSEPAKAVVIYAVNEHGGCDLNPKPTEIKYGVLPAEFTAEEKEKLIEISLEEIESACRNQSSVNWPLFAERMNKMEMFLNHFDFSQLKYLHFASSYIKAIRLLYKNGQGEFWFSKGEEFAKRVSDKVRAKGQETSEALSSIYTEYEKLRHVQFN